MNFGPSAGFMSRMKQNMPGMINAVGSQFGGNMANASRLSGGIFNKRPGMPGAPSRQPGVMPSSAPFGNVNFGGGPSAMGSPSTPGGGFMPPSGMGLGGGNGSGLAGGTGGITGMGSSFMNPNMAGQLWDNYNNSSMPGMGDRYPQQPAGLNRQVFY